MNTDISTVRYRLGTTNSCGRSNSCSRGSKLVRTWSQNPVGEKSSGLMDCHELSGVVPVVPPVVDDVADF